MPTISNVQPDSDLRSSLSFRVYTDGDAPRDTASEWFDRHNIGHLKFKCKAWAAVGRAATAISIEQMTPALAARFQLKPEDFELRFSLTAGCSCGCSPGFVGKLKASHQELSRANVWMKEIPLSDADKTRLQAAMTKQEAKLAAEVAAFEAAQLAAQTAKQEAELAALNAKRDAAVNAAQSSASL